MSGGIAGRGRPGPAGPAGPMGPTGPKGDAAFTLAIGDVTAVPYGQDPAATNVGTNQDQVWDLALVTGATGVLTGPDPPTGTDGTSLGQLYYCTANQTYYGLIELNENDNKWRPLMTQDSAIRTYKLDIGWHTWNARTNGGAGLVSVMFDDVKRSVSVVARLNASLPISAVDGDEVAFFADAHTLSAIIADASLREVDTIPIPYTVTFNGVDTTANWDLLHPSTNKSHGLRRPGHLATYFPPADGTGTTPGSRLVFHGGTVEVATNDTSPAAGTQYGNVASYGTIQGDDLYFNLFKVSDDPEYPGELFASATVEVLYG